MKMVPCWIVAAACYIASLPTTVAISLPLAPVTRSSYKGGEGLTPRARAEAFVSNMTLLEKINVTANAASGPCPGQLGSVPRLGIESICYSDGFNGVALSTSSSQFPSSITVGATWDKKLFLERAKAVGKELKDLGLHAMLGPVTGGPLGRSPYGGRNWEGFSSDPYLTAVASGLSVQGVQEEGIIAISKHLIAYEQEGLRMGLPGGFTNPNWTLVYDSVVDDKTLHENYLLPFAEAVRAGTGGVMCSYNLFNGSFACESEPLINGTLKGELNFPGFVMSDATAIPPTDAAPSANAGLDVLLQVVGNVWRSNLTYAIGNGTVDVSRLDEAATRILTSFITLNDTNTYPSFDNTRWVVGDHSNIIRKIGADSATLLKNSKKGGLPLSKPKGLTVVGSAAGVDPAGLNPFFATPYDTPFTPPVGYISIGGGSGSARAPYLISPFEAISNKAHSTGFYVNWFLSNNVTFGENNFKTFYPKPLDFGIAATETSVVFVSSKGREGWDKTSLDLDNNGSDLINYVAAQCNDTIVIINSGGPVNMASWIDNDNVTAVLFTYYNGQEAGNSVVDVLFGDVAPSGKLPFTIARNESDWNSNSIYTNYSVYQPNHPPVYYSERSLIDYRWFDAKNITPQFEFGFGLSYTTFHLSDLKITNDHVPAADTVTVTNEKLVVGDSVVVGSALYDEVYSVKVTITNTGSVRGSEVAQLYLTFPSTESESQPKRVLRGFEKADLAPGEEQEVTMKLRNKDIAVWRVERQAWEIPAGVFTVSVGSSSRDLSLVGTFNV